MPHDRFCIQANRRIASSSDRSSTSSIAATHSHPPIGKHPCSCCHGLRSFFVTRGGWSWGKCCRQSPTPRLCPSTLAPSRGPVRQEPGYRRWQSHGPPAVRSGRVGDAVAPYRTTLSPICLRWSACTRALRRPDSSQRLRRSPGLSTSLLLSITPSHAHELRNEITQGSGKAKT